MYEPRICTATDAAGVASWALGELVEVARLLNDGSDVLLFQQQFAAPKRPREGMVANASGGTGWHPGGGAGLYQYLGGAWVKL